MDSVSFPSEQLTRDITREVDPLITHKPKIPKQIKVDVAIAGAGAAGLALAWLLIMDTDFEGQICLLDKNFKTPPVDEKIWSFWESEWIPQQVLNNLTEKKWSRLKINVKGYSAERTLHDFSYHSIRCSTYREWMISQLESSSQVILLEDTLNDFEHESPGKIRIDTEEHQIACSWFCNSLPFLKSGMDKKKNSVRGKKSTNPDRPRALQQFLGWEITTKDPQFDPTLFTFMDFRQSDKFSFPFFYVLPFSEHKALVEYTIFTNKPQPNHKLRTDLENYLQKKIKLRPGSYNLERKEVGMIPMAADIDHNCTSTLINIGSAAGCTRASTGYTFARSWKHAQTVVNKIKGKKNKENGLLNRRHQFFDMLFLYQLQQNPESVKNLIKGLFREPNTDQIFRFLSGTTHLSDEIQMVRRMPVIPFMKAFLKNCKHLM